MKPAAFFLGLWAILAVLAPWLAPFDPFALGDLPLAPPSGAHLLGTDALGRDVLSRLIFGARISAWVAGLSVAFALAVGSTLGLLAGHFGGWIDGVISRSTDVMFALPEVLLALVLLAVFGTGLGNLALAIGIVYTPIFARIARAAAIEERGRDYVHAARALGAGEARIIARHLLPNVFPPLLVQTTLSLAFAILAEAALGFLGLGGEPDLPSWGNMLRGGKDWLEQAWWVALAPGLAISGAVLALNVLGDGLRDLLDPRQRGR